MTLIEGLNVSLTEGYVISGFPALIRFIFLPIVLVLLLRYPFKTGTTKRV